MWFDDSMLDAWENGFTPAIQHAGYKPVRIDRQEFLNKIYKYLRLIRLRNGSLGPCAGETEFIALNQSSNCHPLGAC